MGIVGGAGVNGTAFQGCSVKGIGSEREGCPGGSAASLVVTGELVRLRAPGVKCLLSGKGRRAPGVASFLLHHRQWMVEAGKLPEPHL